MLIPSPIPLDDFERVIQTEPDVLGMFYFGSLGRGAATKGSDLDIYIWFSADDPARNDDKLLQLLGIFGETHWLKLEWGAGVFGPDWTQVDFEVGHGQVDEPCDRFVGGTVIKDTDGRLARLIAASTDEVPVETVESASPIINSAIWDLLFVSRTNARGSVWSATGTISDTCKSTYELLGRLRGRRTYGYRYVEELLTPEEQALLTAAWPREQTADENRRAARALWTWAKFVWSETERVLGRPLGLEIDEVGMWAAIDRMYT